MHCDFVEVELYDGEDDPTVMLALGRVPEAEWVAHVALSIDGALGLAGSLLAAVEAVDGETARVAARTASETRYRRGRQRRRSHRAG